MPDPTELPQLFADRIKAEIEAGIVANPAYFTVRRRSLTAGRVYSEWPANDVTAPFPVVVVEWTDYAEDFELREVAYPFQYITQRLSAMVKVFAGDWEKDNRIYEARIWASRLERWLTAQRTLGSFCRQFRVTRVWGDFEQLLARGIIAQAMLEVSAIARETRELRD